MLFLDLNDSIITFSHNAPINKKQLGVSEMEAGSRLFNEVRCFALCNGSKGNAIYYLQR